MKTIDIKNIILVALVTIVTSFGPAFSAPPDEPRVVEVLGGPGQRGGELHTLVGREKDVRLFVVYGYARLVGFNAQLELEPDLLRDVEVEEGRKFTLHLRPGHKWSDGAPFTSEDFRFFWENIANNEMLRPTGPLPAMLVDGEAPQVSYPDEHTVIYEWSGANPFFLPALAAATPMFIYAPGHYLKAFHADFADADTLAKMVEDTGARDWAQLFGRHGHMYKFVNPELPTLQPWRITTKPPAIRLVGERNDHFHRVDSAGTQLPYVDRFVMNVVDNKLIPVKSGAGETDLQARGLAFKDYTFLRENERRSKMQTFLWQTARGAHLALYPNLNATDDVWRDVFRDVRFRRALSLAVNRQEINDILYFGLAQGGLNTVLPQSPLYRPDYREAWANFDPVGANALLDEMGLTERDDRGLRLLPDGRPMELVVETAGEDTEQSDVLGLVHDHFLALGFKIHTKPSQREVLRNRVFSGDTLMSIWFGLENGVPTADMSPAEFVPSSQQHLQWPMWGQYFETLGQAGLAPDMDEATELLAAFDAWKAAGNDQERYAAWEDVLTNHAENVWSVALISGIMQPVSADARLRGVPNKAIFNWEPGAQFGIYMPDTFWFEEK